MLLGDTIGIERNSPDDHGQAARNQTRTIGDDILGRLHDICNKWLSFNGRVPHCALPFEGDRAAIAFFNQRGLPAQLD